MRLISTQRLINFDSTWRFNETDQSEGWATSAHSDWFSDPGPFGYETNPTLQDRIQTPVTPGRITYYFETDFQFSGDLDDVTHLQLTRLVDDAAVFYLNGVEVESFRFNIDSDPAGPLDTANNAVIRCD